MSVTCKLCKSTYTSLYLKLQNNQDIYQCKSCHNAFTHPEPGDINYETEDFHEQFQFQHISQLPRQWKSGLLKQLNLIKKYIPKGANILEIGCGQGLFLKLLQENGYNTFGIEPSHSASRHAQSIGLKVINGYYPHNDLGGIKFDLIIMSHVLEHISSPIQFLNTLSELNNGSYLLLIQTNYEGIVPLKTKNLWYAWLPEQHFWHFTPKGIKNICSLNHFRFIKTEYSTLEHNNYWLSLISEKFSMLGDQFHAVIKLKN